MWKCVHKIISNPVLFVRKDTWLNSNSHIPHTPFWSHTSCSWTMMSHPVNRRLRVYHTSITTNYYSKIIYAHLSCLYTSMLLPQDCPWHQPNSFRSSHPPRDPGWHDDSALPPHLHARLLITRYSRYPTVSEANFLVIRLGLHTEIVAAASDFTCVWELMFKMGRVVFGDCQSTKHWVTC